MKCAFIGVKMPFSLRDDLDALVVDRGTTISQLVRRLIEQEAQRSLSASHQCQDAVANEE